MLNLVEIDIIGREIKLGKKAVSSKSSGYKLSKVLIKSYYISIYRLGTMKTGYALVISENSAKKVFKNFNWHTKFKTDGIYNMSTEFTIYTKDTILKKVSKLPTLPKIKYRKGENLICRKDTKRGTLSLKQLIRCALKKNLLQ